MFKVIITCTCLDTRETSHFSFEVEDIALLWKKEQMSKFKCASTGSHTDVEFDWWTTSGVAKLDGGYTYIKTWTQYKI